MADNVIIDPGVGGATIATDDIGGVQYQRVKIAAGNDNYAVDVSRNAPLPVTQTVAPEKILTLKTWERCTQVPYATNAVVVVGASKGPDQWSYSVSGTTAAWLYDPSEDSWAQLASPALGSFGAGAASCWHPGGPSGTALAGTSTTITTSTTVNSDLEAASGLNYRIRITGGTGAGQERLIDGALYGANSVVTVTVPWDINPDATSTYQLMTGRLYVFGGATLAAGSFKYFDYCTLEWSGNLSITGLPATFGTDARLTGTPHLRGMLDSSTKAFVTSTATAGGASTLTDASQTWTTNQWTNFQVRLTAGTGAGQVRAISSNTTNVLTVSSPWTVQPDATTTYKLGGNDDHLYLMGGGAVTLYRYSITGNTWTALTPTVARAGAPTAGSGLVWAHGVTNTAWSGKSGTRLYSFRVGNTLDYYDLAANAWTSGIPTYIAQETIIGIGSSSVYDGGNYVYTSGGVATTSIQRFFKLDLGHGTIEPWATNQDVVTGNTLAVGTRLWITQCDGGGNRPIYHLYAPTPGLNTNATPSLYRMQII
jgi:hypothetical protein